MMNDQEMIQSPGERLLCSAHSLELIVNNGMRDVRRISLTIAKTSQRISGDTICMFRLQNAAGAYLSKIQPNTDRNCSYVYSRFTMNSLSHFNYLYLFIFSRSF